MINKIKCSLGYHKLEHKTRWGDVNWLSFGYDYQQCKHCKKEFSECYELDTRIQSIILILVITILIVLAIIF